MIKMLNIKGRACPIVICDVCQKRIESSEAAAAVFQRSDIEVDGDVSQVLHVHKGQCHDDAEQKIGNGKGAPWQELDHHIYFLIGNVGTTPKIIAERGARIAELNF